MTVIYQTTITHIGQSVPDVLCDQILATFREGAPTDIKEFCFIHSYGEPNSSLQVGIQFESGQHHYPVTVVGNVTEQNLREFGHITLRSDGQSEAEFSGTVRAVGSALDGTTPGCTLKFVV